MKTKLLTLLTENNNGFIDKNKLAHSFKITEQAVTYLVDKLTKDGYNIELIDCLGYRLKSSTVSARTHRIYSFLKHKEISIHAFDSVSSTNDVAKKLWNYQPLLVISEHQWAGKGQHTKSFFSPARKGVYMSLCIQPKHSLELTQLYTLCAAVAITRCLKSLFDLDIAIKWLNDLFIHNQKLGGILCEGNLSFQTKTYTSFIIGIGLNLTCASDIPQDIENIYTYLEKHTSKAIDPDQLIAGITDEFLDLLTAFPQNRKQLIDEYKAKNIILGKSFTTNSEKEIYKAIDIDPNGRLIAFNANKQIKYFSSGSLSLYEN